MAASVVCRAATAGAQVLLRARRSVRWWRERGASGQGFGKRTAGPAADASLAEYGNLRSGAPVRAGDAG
ncbi:ubiquinol-cytochrome c reductase core protein 1 [Homo sapiens]|uniref:Ubiquinol-cytochrome c reductase core protein 1 n=1 Tax=Homo sapiens TaxID=9606 RepID=F8WEF1_HUMAN|nr:ubiquinol-cytochrome c reductase core protein 1 [Homo sapiens]KAI4029517.1 ubiquinol-cytochrome c reductase core protein 1 [Homo sapiens]